MKEMITLIIEALVSDKEAVSINEVEKERIIVYEVKVAESDMGKVIGREGRIAKAIRTLAKAVGTTEKKKITIDFIG